MSQAPSENVAIYYTSEVRSHYVLMSRPHDVAVNYYPIATRPSPVGD
jgi:hypothetical protein